MEASDDQITGDYTMCSCYSIQNLVKTNSIQNLVKTNTYNKRVWIKVSKFSPGVNIDVPKGYLVCFILRKHSYSH